MNMLQRQSRIFQKIRTAIVWAALCERTFEEGAAGGGPGAHKVGGAIEGSDFF